MSRRITLLVFLAAAFRGWAQEVCTALSDTALIHFDQSRWDLNLSLGNNALVYNGIHGRLAVIQGDSIYRIRHVSVFGGASPEGSEKFNMFLSEKRAVTLFDRFQRYRKLMDSDKTFVFLGRDWEGVLAYSLSDATIPYRSETIALLNSIATEKRKTGKEPIGSLLRLKRLRGGVPYIYLYNNIFPKVRATRLVIDYTRRLAPSVAAPRLENTVLSHIDSIRRFGGNLLTEAPAPSESLLASPLDAAASVRKHF